MSEDSPERSLMLNIRRDFCGCKGKVYLYDYGTDTASGHFAGCADNYQYADYLLLQYG